MSSGICECELHTSDTWQSFSKHINQENSHTAFFSAVTFFISAIGIQALEEKKKKVVHNLSLTGAEMANATTQVIQDQ